MRSFTKPAAGLSTYLQAAGRLPMMPMWWSHVWLRGEELHEAHAALDEPPGDEAARAEFRRRRIVDAVELLRRLALAGNIERFLGRGLELGGQLVAGDARLEVGLAGMPIEMLVVELVEKAEIVLLRLAAEIRGGVEIGDARFLGAHRGALVDRGQPAVGPVVHAEHRQAARIGERDVGGQFLRLRAERVGEPAPDRRAPAEAAAILQRVDRLAVIVHAGLHAAQQHDVVDDARRSPAAAR